MKSRRMEMTNFKKTIIIFGAVHVIIFLGLLPTLAQFFYPGTGSLENYLAQKMLDGQIPYHDFASEYPPLALLSFLLPGILTSNTIAYSWVFAAELMICDLLVLLMLADLAAAFKVSVRNTLVVYTLFLLATGPILIARYDLFPAMLVLAAVWAFIKGRVKLAWIAAALGFAAKLYPVIIVPFFVIYQLKNRQYGRLIQGGAVFLLTLVILFLPWVIIDANGFWQSFTYHFERGLHAESTYGTALLTGQLLGLTTTQGDLTYGSWNLSSPLADSLAKISFPLTACFLLIIYGFFTWRLRQNSAGDSALKMSGPSAVRFFEYAALTVTVFMLTNKVFSAQYLAWLCPLLPLATKGREYLVPALFMAAAVLTQYVYPYNYINFELGKATPVLILTFRNLLLIVMAIAIALAHRSQKNIYQMPGNRFLRS
jgi:uncharacterized membrane protein